MARRGRGLGRRGIIRPILISLGFVLRCRARRNRDRRYGMDWLAQNWETLMTLLNTVGLTVIALFKGKR